MKINRIFKECPECLGEGRYEKTIPVVDYNHGGYLKGVMSDCHYCNGIGEVMYDGIEEEEEC